MAVAADRILIVEDEDPLAETVRYHLEREGFEVTVASDGRVAYVSCDASRQVAVVDLAAFKVERLIDAGPLADGLAWAASAR